MKDSGRRRDLAARCEPAADHRSLRSGARAGRAPNYELRTTNYLRHFWLMMLGPLVLKSMAVTHSARLKEAAAVFMPFQVI